MEVDASPPPLSAEALHRRLLRNYLGGTLFALSAGGLLFAFGLNLTLSQILALFFVLVPLAFVPTILIDVWQIQREIRVIQAALRRAPEADYQAAVIQALNLPYITGRRIILFHLPSFLISITVLVIIANTFFNYQLSLLTYFNLALIAILVSTSHGLFEYFGADYAVHPILPWLWQMADTFRSARHHKIIGLGMRRKLLIVSVFAVFAPLLILGLTTLVRARELLLSVGRASGLDELDINRLTFSLQVWVIVFIIVSMAVMVALALVLAFGVTRAAKEMAAAMEKVEEGNLETQLPISTTDEFAQLFEGFNLMTEGLNERERLRDAIGRYLAPELAEEVMKRGVQLGGQMVSATMLFADIRGFTTISEKLTPAEVVELLNRYFAAVEPAIQENGGWINKFGGDSLLAVFGAPVPHADHARRAIHAALAIRAALNTFNAEQTANGDPQVEIGVGIHSGTILAGNVGSPTRMEYTVIGDVVNVASRIDGLNKDWNTDILVSADAWEAAGLNGSVPVRAMPPVALKGKSQLTQVYAVE